MRITCSVLVGILGATSQTLVRASPATSLHLVRQYDEDVGVNVAAVGQCPMDCWNEAVEEAECDPNTDDDCLCGPFFEAVTDCTSESCNTEDNLASFNLLALRSTADYLNDSQCLVYDTAALVHLTLWLISLGLALLQAA
ncbi:hypothetical protein LEMA_P058680.1 [Plenodomus lingam JN3]|uniref:CFEM domain-containing protein n=2 Tax=Leptosphaeria maculans TaxID=5022 RepID=E4ZHK1_LEPMJ|nr:hypothetical protein LEMA_P058680.1 [Plenodomus lingam JN3]CBX90834.1 hypothetical protein LEMA_P058680.1 [Plenodomus lingam JN3]